MVRGSTLLRVVHIIAGFIWLGLILYTHLGMIPSRKVREILKPEKVLIWSAIPVVGVSGVALAFYRIYRLEQFFNTKFGIILLIKTICYILLAISMGYVELYLNKKLFPGAETARGKKEAFHINELAQYDGKGDNPAYIGYKDRVYDVSISILWDDGVHLQQHFAGQEFTQEALEDSPHREEALARVACVGELINTAALAKAHRLFLTLAYVNLGLVIVALVCLGWWRFG